MDRSSGLEEFKKQFQKTKRNFTFCHYSCYRTCIWFHSTVGVVRRDLIVGSTPGGFEGREAIKLIPARTRL